MRVLFCALLIALTGLPTLAVAGEAPSNRQLAKQLDNLEQRIERLERRDKAETKAEKKAATAEKAKAK